MLDLQAGFDRELVAIANARSGAIVLGHNLIFTREAEPRDMGSQALPGNQ
ncbi:MAG: hypothetical protein MUE44_27305 [Oscillatoriaceae cyanobacterium Prado104]|jgi:hypothetical protein|nr:hypothetical protein [Oscillatoriaceae cyanobacterium Prado104]